MALLNERQQTAQALARELHRMGAAVVNPMPLADDAPRPAPIFDAIGDARVRYMHVPNRMTIGAKRNALSEAAGGEVVALFDDDDFYAPHYIADMLSLMDERSADFVQAVRLFPLRAPA
jgi:cellulose synthase/poly-beta-1,6-N-acetylglucosamine synthase-like glycosyltransferase